MKQSSIVLVLYIIIILLVPGCATRKTHEEELREQRSDLSNRWKIDLNSTRFHPAAVRDIAYKDRALVIVKFDINYLPKEARVYRFESDHKLLNGHAYYRYMDVTVTEPKIRLTPTHFSKAPKDFKFRWSDPGINFSFRSKFKYDKNFGYSFNGYSYFSVYPGTYVIKDYEVKLDYSVYSSRSWENFNHVFRYEYSDCFRKEQPTTFTVAKGDVIVLGNYSYIASKNKIKGKINSSVFSVKKLDLSDVSGLSERDKNTHKYIMANIKKHTVKPPIHLDIKRISKQCNKFNAINLESLLNTLKQGIMQEKKK